MHFLRGFKKEIKVDVISRMEGEKVGKLEKKTENEEITKLHVQRSSLDGLC